MPTLGASEHRSIGVANWKLSGQPASTAGWPDDSRTSTGRVRGGNAYGARRSTCHVAVARLSTYAHTAKLKDTTISDVPRLVRFATGETTRSFYAMRHRFDVYPFAKSSDTPAP